MRRAYIGRGFAWDETWTPLPTVHLLPKALQDAIERLLYADAESHRSPRPRSSVERIDALRAARRIITEWRKGSIDLGEAVSRIESLVRATREWS